MLKVEQKKQQMQDALKDLIAILERAKDPDNLPNNWELSYWNVEQTFLGYLVQYQVLTGNNSTDEGKGALICVELT